MSRSHSYHSRILVPLFAGFALVLPLIAYPSRI